MAGYTIILAQNLLRRTISSRSVKPLAYTDRQTAEMLYFEERNADKAESIIFLHGGSGNHLEWNLVASQTSLAAYHLILVDLPGHSASREIPFWSLEAAAAETRTVIREHAHSGRAHVVGFSLGGFVALVLAARHADAVLSTFSSGAYPYRRLFKWAMARPNLMWYVGSLEIPGLAAMVLRRQGINGGDEWLAEAKANKSREQTRVMMAELSSFGTEQVRAAAASGVRTLVIAGGKMDQVDAVRDMGLLLKKEARDGVHNEAAVVGNAYHPWHMQLPELFAAGVQAWVQELELPDGFEIM